MSWFKVSFGRRPEWVTRMWERIGNGLYEWAERQDRWFSLLYAVAVVTALYMGYCIWHLGQSNGEVVYCHVAASDDTAKDKRLWHLRAVRTWQPNTTVGYFDSFEETVKAAERINCPLR